MSDRYGYTASAETVTTTDGLGNVVHIVRVGGITVEEAQLKSLRRQLSQLRSHWWVRLGIALRLIQKSA